MKILTVEVILDVLLLLFLKCSFAVGDEQVMKLLNFMKSSVENDPNGFLKDWGSSSSSPCKWNGVVCFPAHEGQVTDLNLQNANLHGFLHIYHLMALPSLRNLRLSGNRFYGNLSFPSDSSSCSSSFESLDLSSNNFSDSLDLGPLLSACNRLSYLNLSQNSIPHLVLKPSPSVLQVDASKNKISNLDLLDYSLSDCQNLSLLNLSENKLSGNLMKSSLFSCNNLGLLDLSHNNVSGDFNDVEFGACGNLAVLDLSFNSLSGSDFPASLGNCKNLEKLLIGHNLIQLKIPGGLLSKLKRLRNLGLAHNSFSGEIPSELGGICTTLEDLDLSGNQLSGELPSTFRACSSTLISLNLSSNHLSGDFLSSVVSRLGNLRRLSVSFNNLTGPVPKSLQNCPHLEVLDLSSNRFDGGVPSWLCSPVSALQTMTLANNQLSGSVPPQLGFCKNLMKIDFSFNRLSGSIPLEIWNLLNLSDLIFWANSISGEIPEGICSSRYGGGGKLETLILNHNFISGPIPKSISKCTQLVWVSLSSNQLTGEIPPQIGELSKLAILQLGNNSLSGAVPPGLGRCKNLIWLDLNSNDLTGPVPAELADQAGLIVPGGVSGKHFAFVRNEGGPVCRGAGGLVYFDGIREEILENFPVFHSCPSIRVYSGTTIYTFSSNGSMIYLDLSYNMLSGTIPPSFGSMSYLQVLNLGHNDLTGTIPFSFGGLKRTGVLDVSHNRLHGRIPGSLGALSFLNDLDLSNNNLSGEIPSSGQLITFPAARYENNSDLCGLPLRPCGASDSSSSAQYNQQQDRKKRATTIWMVAGFTASFIALCGLLVALLRVRKGQEKKAEERRDKYIETLSTSGSSTWKLCSVPEPLSINVATFEKPLRKLTFAHLLEATNGFSTSSLIGSGGFGEVYKAHLKDGSVVAIKKLIHVTGQGDREFMAEMETIGKIKHRNLVPLLGYCKIGEERLLVYEYMKWGSLEDVLHETRDKAWLNWAARKKIAVGSARGLAFLHHSCLPHIIHRDMKSSNVLLDENLEARVSDFGMARLVNALDTHLSVSTLAGTPGYVPPEYYHSFRCTTKGDVYSYGVILLELLSGKRPINTRDFGDDNNLVGWAKLLHKGNRSHEIFDPQLMSDLSGECDQLYQYLKIALECLEEKPYQRPTMIQVMAMFKASSLHDDSESDILDDVSVLIDESPEGEP
ncbi:unnamed protein product [Cuscuta epithymum]|uniref:non-specific serine/threonine protein kinase n=1 Tax=Cuscuta epithymum TaxID=186058 RepID=A0AAV0C4X4_9ASTE|nr:unnamed protein product [Cuscuta epithymum]